MNNLLPIFDNRTIVGYARSKEHARRIVAKMLQHVPAGWRIVVKERDCGIVDLPFGFVYSVCP